MCKIRIGQLALWSPTPGYFRLPGERLRHVRQLGMTKFVTAFGSPFQKTAHLDPLLEIPYSFLPVYHGQGIISLNHWPVINLLHFSLKGQCCICQASVLLSPSQEITVPSLGQKSFVSTYILRVSRTLAVRGAVGSGRSTRAYLLIMSPGPPLPLTSRWTKAALLWLTPFL